MIKEDDPTMIVEFEDKTNKEFKEIVQYVFDNKKTTSIINIIYANQTIAVGEIVGLSAYSSSNVSQSLTKLTELGIIDFVREGNSKGYFIKDKMLLEILLVRDVYAALKGRQVSLEENKEVCEEIKEILVPYIKETNWS